MHASVMEFFQQSLMVGKQFLIPGIACPSIYATVGIIIQPFLPYAKVIIHVYMMPIHINNSNRHWDIIICKVIHQIDILLLGIWPVAAPPVAQRPARDYWCTATQLIERFDCSFVVVTISEDVGIHSASAGCQLTAGIQQKTLGVIIYCHTIPCTDTHIEWDMIPVVLVYGRVFAKMGTICIQSAASSKEILCIIQERNRTIFKGHLTLGNISHIQSKCQC